ncbi:MAG: uroporphyrinogen-III C-methyltransferase [Vicinamibacterales bacterium]
MRTLVYIIGSGPGTPGLLTTRGLQCLQSADVVIFDRTVHRRVLDLAPRGVERIDVGRPTREVTDQDAICFLLAEKAREGKVVARLKMGDPFLFDHGGEEALFLHEQGIPFEVVPGVPVSLSTAAYAGIPLTYTGGGDTLTFVRGHEAGNGGKLRVNWTNLAKLDGTIAAHGGRAELASIARGLLDHGRAADERAAIVHAGTLAGQQTELATLREISRRLDEDPLDGSATLVVGKVVGLREHLRWFDERPLFGRRVLVTRSRHQAGELVALLEAAGAEAIEAPVLQIAPLEHHEELDLALASLSGFDWIVFANVNAAEGLMQRIYELGRDARALAGPRLCSLGVGVSDRLARFGIRVDAAVEGLGADAVVEALGGRDRLGRVKVLAPGALGGRDTLAEALTAAGADVTQAPSFRTLAVDDNPELDVYGQLLQRRIDVVTFTSAAAVRSFAALYGVDQVADLLTHTTVATAGPAAGDAVRQLGVTSVIEPGVPSIAALVDAIRAHFQ